MDVEPHDGPETPPHRGGGGQTTPLVDERAPNMNGARGAPRLVWPPPPTGREIGTVLARERAARSQAEGRAARAEEGIAALRAALAVVTSVAEVSVEAAALLVDEARRYASTLTEAARQEQRSIMETSAADALQVIAEAKATVAQLRADLLEELSEDEGVEIGDGAAKAADGIPAAPRRRLRRRPTPERDTAAKPSLAVPEPGRDSLEGAPAPARVSPPPAGEVG